MVDAHTCVVKHGESYLPLGGFCGDLSDALSFIGDLRIEV